MNLSKDMLAQIATLIGVFLTGGIFLFAALRYYREYWKNERPNLIIEPRESKTNCVSSIGEEQANAHFYYKVTNNGDAEAILVGVIGQLTHISGDSDYKRDSIEQYFEFSTFGSPLSPEQHVEPGRTKRLKAHCGIADPQIVEKYDSAEFKIIWKFEGIEHQHQYIFEEKLELGDPMGTSRRIHTHD